jgi:uncharacterized membrane protein
MNRAELKAAAKEQIKGNIGILFLCFLIIFGIGLACGFTPMVGSLASFLVTPPLGVGLCMVYLGLIEGKMAEVGTLFKGFQVFGKSIWLSVLIYVFTFLWSLLFVIPGIIKSFSYAMANYVLADNPEMTAREALRESKEIMQGHKWELFVLQLSFILWHLLGAITLGLAYIYVVPYMSASVANFYQKIKRQPQVVEAPVEEAPVEEMI